MFLAKFSCVFLFNFVLPIYSDLLDLEFPKSKLNERPSSLVSVETRLGTVIGYKQDARNQTINIFYGLPFAEPPTGKLRFKKSKLIRKFPSNPYAALSFKPHCHVSRIRYNPRDRFDEDCLYMTIYTPDIERSKVNGVCRKKFAVIVYITGAEGSIFRMSLFSKWNEQHHLYNGELFPTFETIFLMFNYRQRAFSSLYLDDVYPGNLPLFDQNLALQWTSEYIGDFCGDNQRITLNGHSFGAFSTQLHLISKLSNRMINTAIVQSSPGFFKVI